MKRSSFLLLLLFVAGVFGVASAQTERLGTVKYTAVSGWSKSSKGNTVAFTHLDQATGKYCLITLYAATASTGTAKGDFAREWNRLVVQTLNGAANPATETQNDGGWTAVSGGSQVNSELGKGAALLTVISGSGQTITILAVFNDAKYSTQIEAFVGSIEIDRSSATAAPAAEQPTLDKWGNLFIPPPTRQLTIADLVGNWGDNPGRISTQYVYRDSGSHAGTDSLHFTSKWTIDSDGGYINDFFEVRNGKKLRDITTGTVSVAGQVLSIKREKSTARYVVRGWLDLPDITILKVAGPWYDGQEIPERTFTDPPDSYMTTSKWVRKK